MQTHFVGKLRLYENWVGPFLDCHEKRHRAFSVAFMSVRPRLLFAMSRARFPSAVDPTAFITMI